MVGRCKYQRAADGGGEGSIYIGNDAQSYRGILKLNYPVEHGIVTDWNEMENIWRYAFNNELRAASEEHPVLMTEPPLNPIANRERMTLVMFEEFEVPAFYVEIQSVLSMYSFGRMTGCVVESGDGVTCSVPICDGCMISRAILRLDLGGKDLTNYIIRLLIEKGINTFTTTAECEIAKDMKEKLTYVARDFDEETNNAAKISDLTKSYDLPDGSSVSISDERLKCPEVLFRPFLINKQVSGIHECTYQSIAKCEIEYRDELYANILLCGGNSMLSGFPERMTKELTALAPSAAIINVVAPAERQHSAWIGGSILASSIDFQKTCITKAQYDEVGPSIVRKCVM